MSSPRRRSPGIRFFFSRVFPWVFIVFGAVGLYSGTRGVHHAKESLTWPVAEGRIQKSSVEYQPGDAGTDAAPGGTGGTYSAEVLYTFSVAGRTHRGNTVAFCDNGSCNPSRAQAIVERYPKDKVVSVRYLPSDPSICVLEPGLPGQAWLRFGLGLLFFVVGALSAVLLPRAMKEQPISRENLGPASSSTPT
jgi:Protein of unknown function (DUF3592)